MSPSKKFIVLIPLFLMVGGGVWIIRQRFSDHREVKYRSSIVQQGPIRETVEATGSVLPLNRVEIKPPISGRIENLLVDEGTKVKEGQILAWMSSSDRAAILDAARAQGPEELKKWDDDYKPTPVIAPLSGLIILNNVVVGQTVDPSTVLYAMSDTLVVIGQVDESDIGNIHKGMRARITLDAYPEKTVEGKVFDILYEGKNVSNVITYNVKIKLAQVPSFFRSQMTANISFIVSSKENATLIPSSVIRELPNGVKQVLLPGPDGKPVSREITTGIESNDTVEVTSGLQPGDQVLLTQGRYVPQQGPQSSPLTFGGKPSTSSSPTTKSHNKS